MIKATLVFFSLVFGLILGCSVERLAGLRETSDLPAVTPKTCAPHGYSTHACERLAIRLGTRVASIEEAVTSRHLSLREATEQLSSFVEDPRMPHRVRESARHGIVAIRLAAR